MNRFSKNKECAKAHSRACGGRLRHQPYTPQCASRGAFLCHRTKFPMAQKSIGHILMSDRCFLYSMLVTFYPGIIKFPIQSSEA